MNAFLDQLRANELTLMLGIRSGRTADVVRVAHATGHHAVMVDLEHATLSLDVAAQLCATAADLGMAPFVWVSEREYAVIGPLLDCGAQGIIAPRIETAAQAEEVVRACQAHGKLLMIGDISRSGSPRLLGAAGNRSASTVRNGHRPALRRRTDTRRRVHHLVAAIMTEVVVVDGVRTAQGGYGGALSVVRPDDLAGLVVLGAANQAGEDNRNVARMAVQLAGVGQGVALLVERV
jgi:hypothetical protein